MFPKSVRICDSREASSLCLPPSMTQTKTSHTSMACLRTSLLTLVLLLLQNCHTHGGSISGPIKTVVVLVMENRSFDHMLGWMKRLNPNIDGVDSSQSNPLSALDPNSARVFFNSTSGYVVEPDPGHSFQAIREQIFGSADTSADPAPMNGFVQQAYSVNGSMVMAQHVMSGYPPEMVPVYKTLVEEFAVFDRWFASVPTSTQPNRMYVHSATSSGATSNIPALLAKGYPQRTIFENLDDAGIAFGIYYQNIPATLFFRNLRKLKYVTKFVPYGLSFKRHAREGKLPAYVVVEQRYKDTKVEPANDDQRRIQGGRRGAAAPPISPEWYLGLARSGARTWAKRGGSGIWWGGMGRICEGAAEQAERRRRLGRLQLNAGASGISDLAFGLAAGRRRKGRTTASFRSA